jgi:dehydrogenase/reductase SDR family protein 7
MLSSLFHAFSWLCVSYVLFLVVQLVRIFLNDCDLILSLYERWGKRPEAVLAGKVVWITGASSGIGEAIAYELAKAGSRLILSARGEEDLRRVANKCRDLSPTSSRDAHLVLVLDLLDTEQHSPLTTKIDVLINNAGSSQRAVVLDTELRVDRAVLELNTIGTVSLTKCVLPHMAERGQGSIVVISSIAGVIGSPGSASYSMSKHALHGFFNTLRMEVAEKGVTVHMVCPGPVDTPYFKRQFGPVLGKGPEVTRDPGKKDSTRVTAERCAQLTVVALANRLDEVWISKNPILFFTYMFHYCPLLANWLGKRIGGNRAKAIKAGKKVVDDSFFSSMKKTE